MTQIRTTRPSLLLVHLYPSDVALKCLSPKWGVLPEFLLLPDPRLQFCFPDLMRQPKAQLSCSIISSLLTNAPSANVDLCAVQDLHFQLLSSPCSYIEDLSPSCWVLNIFFKGFKFYFVQFLLVSSAGGSPITERSLPALFPLRKMFLGFVFLDYICI